MGMSTGIVGFVPPDEEWKKMKKVWDTCKEAGVEPPEEVLEFFDDEYPDELGKEIDFKYDLKIAKEYSSDMCSGFEIEIKDIPKKVKVIRFYNSW